jgi:hypothetical protein
MNVERRRAKSSCQVDRKKAVSAPLSLCLSHAEFACCKRAEVDRLIVIVYSEFKRDASRFSAGAPARRRRLPVV